MAKFSIYHNPNCSTSRHAVDVAHSVGADVDVVLYLKTKPDAAELRSIIDRLDVEPTQLVRRDSYFAEQGLTDEDVRTADQVIDTLVEHPRLLQRPLIASNDRVIIGRPKDRVEPFLTS